VKNVLLFDHYKATASSPPEVLFRSWVTRNSE